MSELAARAGADALARAGLPAAELDLVLVATSTADEITPNAAPLVAGLLGAERAGALDVGAACTGWLGALAMACGQIESGRARTALVIGADLLSRFLDFSDRDTTVVFADGAGAAVVCATDDQSTRIGPILLRADHAYADLIRLTRGARIQMRGPETFRAAVARLTEVTGEALERAGLGIDDIDLFVYHQANSRIIRAVGTRLALPARARGRLRRPVRELVHRDPADRAHGRAERRTLARRRPRVARRVRRRAHVGRDRARLGRAPRQLNYFNALRAADVHAVVTSRMYFACVVARWDTHSMSLLPGPRSSVAAIALSARS